MRRILIIAPNWIGDAVMSQPLLANIKVAEPDALIDVLATSWVAPVYRACAEVNAVIQADLQHGKLQWSLRRTLAKQIAKEHYSVCYVLPNSLKSALIPWLAGIPVRIGYSGEMRSGLINRAKPNPSKTVRAPMVEHYASLCATPQTAADDQTKPNALVPRLRVTESMRQAADQKLAAAGIRSDALFVLCPGAEYGPSKRWPASHFAQLANSILRANPKAQVVLLGSAADHAIGQSIIESADPSDRILNWCGDTSLDEAMAIIGACAHLVTNDSGLMHIGAALGVNQVALFGSSDPKHTPPISPKARIIYLHLPCSPCHKRVCPLGHLHCLNQIHPQQVFTALQ